MLHDCLPLPNRCATLGAMATLPLPGMLLLMKAAVRLTICFHKPTQCDMAVLHSFRAVVTHSSCTLGARPAHARHAGCCALWRTMQVLVTSKQYKCNLIYHYIALSYSVCDKTGVCNPRSAGHADLRFRLRQGFFMRGDLTRACKTRNELLRMTPQLTAGL